MDNGGRIMDNGGRSHHRSNATEVSRELAFIIL